MTNLSTNFLGFPHLDANFIWCPNQFLDQCVVGHDRGVVRLVGYVIFQTLRLLDRDGIPVQQNVSVSFKKIVEEAGVSRGAASESIGLALENRFIVCVTRPIAKTVGHKGQVGQYALVWHEEFSGTNQPFAGFYSGEGRRTQIPHAFFTDVLPNETLATIRVVAAVIRHTIGYSNQFGGRRSDAPLSYRVLQQYTGLSRPALAKAIRVAIAKGYIVVVQKGSFSSDPQQSRASTYSLNWLSRAQNAAIGSKNEPLSSKKRASVQKVNQDQFSNFTDMRSEYLPGNRFNKLPTNKEPRKKTNKQCVADENLMEIVELLQQQGIAERTARKMATSIPVDQIKRQIDWLPYRKIRTSKAGYLIDACLNQYDEPSLLKESRRPAQLKHFEELRDALRITWQSQPVADRVRWKQQAYDKASDRRVKASIAFTTPDDDCPHKLVLAEMATGTWTAKSLSSGRPVFNSNIDIKNSPAEAPATGLRCATGG